MNVSFRLAQEKEDDNPESIGGESEDVTTSIRVDKKIHDEVASIMESDVDFHRRVVIQGGLELHCAYRKCFG